MSTKKNHTPGLHSMHWISTPELQQMKEWFTAYVRSFCHGEPQQQRNFLLKQEHTLRVCEEIVDLGGEIGLQEDELVLAETTALLHDIGRFEQYARYHTFVDMRSGNHADLGLSVIARNRLLDGFDAEVQLIIIEAVRHHNRADLPQAADQEWFLYAKLLRDADKLDIWRVVTDYYDRVGQERNEAIELDLPDTPELSRQVLDDLAAARIVQVRHLRTLNDFKLLQMGWVYDINFDPTCSRISERRYLEKILRVLPADAAIYKIYRQMQAYLSDRIAAAPGLRPAEIISLIRAEKPDPSGE
jgi:hypothetical protein